MKTKKKAWAVAASVMVVLALVLAAAIAAHAAGLAQDQAEEAARRSRLRCDPAGSADAGQITQAVRALLSGATGDVAVPGLSSPSEQIPNAKAVVATGLQMQISARGQVIALATALQESDLRNLPSGDRDSLGLFQQRPSQGWGTREQILDPVYASTRFYSVLRSVDGWEQLPLTVAAQRVQRSAFPDAYAKHEPLATALQQAIAPALGPAVSAPGGALTVAAAGCTAGDGDTAVPAGALPAGYRIPPTAPPAVQTAIRWALGQLGTPYQWGGSCTDPHGSDPAGRCDCSSLVQRAYGVVGIRLSRTTYDQVNEGVAVPAGALLPGDLVFTRGTADRPEHVAMSIGDGLLVQAPRTGRNVEIVPLEGHGQVLAARRVA